MCINIGVSPTVEDLNFQTLNVNADNVIAKVDKIKDLGVTFDSRLKFDEHIDIKISKAYQMLGIIERNFIYFTPDSFVVLYKSLVRSHLEYAVCVWNPHHQALIEPELSYRNQIARQLRTQYVHGIYYNPVTLKSRLRVTQGHWKRTIG